MKEPLEEWGPKEREARKALNCIRLELPTTVAHDLITCVLKAFEELRNAGNHGCCGCSCHVCEKTHQGGQHTPECWNRFIKGVEYGTRPKPTVASYETRQEASVGDDTE